MAGIDATTGTTPTRLEDALEELDRLVNWERRDRTADMGRTLEPVRDLLARSGDPHLRPRVVHVSGTKGKGSVASIVAGALSAAGVRCGCYASPHVERVTERVRLDGEEVEEDVLAHELERVLALRELAITEGTPAAAATWFDLFTVAAFQVFGDARCEWIVLECGLGGRLDSTNAADGDVCVLTNVDLEHTSVLGDTIRAISEEKAAILPPGGVLVVGTTEDGGDLCAVAKEVAARRGGRLRFLTELPGSIAERNERIARLVLEEVEVCGGPPGVSCLEEGVLCAARLPARAERFEIGDRSVILDGGHVASSVSLLLAEISAEEASPGTCVAVLALGREKDASSVLKALRGRVDRLHCTTSTEGPLASGEDLARAGRELGIDALDAGTPREAFEAALEGDASRILVLGSFYLAGELRPLLRERAEASDTCSPSSPTSSSPTPS